MIDPQDLRAHARGLLERGEVAFVAGYRAGTAGTGAVPAFAATPDQADALVWDPSCVHNLVLYMVEERKRSGSHGKPVAIVAKGCDARSITVLVQEHSFRRDEVHIIGVSCEGTGVADRRKLQHHLGGRSARAAAFAAGDRFRITADDGETIEVPARDVLADRCLECEAAFPDDNDVAFGEAPPARPFRPRFTTADAAGARPGAARWTFWQRHFERCLRCFACRSVCPMCYCEECVVDSIAFAVSPDTGAEEKANRVKWIERSAVTSENAGYHLVRALHLAGRCTDCGECERVCPVNIPLRLLNTKLEKEAATAFGYRAGLDASQPSLVSSFRDDDPNDFIR